MAKAKKKETLTPEERLQAALVPDWEQPYKVPDNWCWVKLSSLSKLISKGTTPKGGKSSYTNDGVKFLRVENINDEGTISHENIVYVSEDIHKTFLKRSILEENDILISIAGTLGKTGIIRNVDLPMNTNQAVAFIRIALDKINVKYIKNAIDSPVIQDLLLGKTKVTSIPNLTLEIIGECPIPLPPLPEQQRIVYRIESLFARLDEAKQKAQDALDSFETRKAAILHKAFTGELTAQWRNDHGIGMESWENNTLGQYLQPLESKKPQGEEFRYIDIDSIDNINQVVREPKKILVKDAPSRANRGLKTNDVIFSMVRPYLKNIAYIDERLSDCIASTGFYVCRCKQDLSPRYLYYFLCSKDAIDYLMQFMKGDNSPSIRKNDLLEMPVSFPMIPEQNEIVRILDDLIAKEQQAKEAAEAVLEQIDLIKKSILARAFRGELGTNDPTEESAVELVKEVIERSAQIKNKPKTKIKRTVIPAKIKSVLSNSNEEEIVKLLMKSAPKAASVQMIMSISKKKFELMDALRNLEQKQIIIKDSLGGYLLKG